MNFYQVTGKPGGDHNDWYGTQAEAHIDAKKVGKFGYPAVRIELIDVQTDKAGVLAILRDGPIITKVVQTWKLTPRGGLADCPNGE